MLVDEGKISGVSYAGSPVSHTVMFVAKKVEGLLENLTGIEGCLVFAETGVSCPEEVLRRNEVRQADNPQLEYARYVQRFVDIEKDFNDLFPPVPSAGGYLISEKATIGDNVIIEAGAVIYGNVTIGDGSIIHSGTVIRSATIGKGVLIKSNACIGDQSFNFARDEKSRPVLIPSLGHVRIDDFAQIGCLSTVCRGLTGETVIESYAMIDDHVHIGHDCHVGSNSEIAASVGLGGYTRIGSSCFFGVGASTKNRVVIGDNCTIGMASAVIRSVENGQSVFGNPARPFK